VNASDDRLSGVTPLPGDESSGASALPSPGKPKQFGKYLLLEKIGSGGMAEIFKAVVRGAGDFHKVLVVKRILLAYSKDPSFVKMFTSEAQITSPLQHANIVSIYEFDQVDGQYYLAMEYVHGRDLQRVMARANKLGRSIPTDVALYIVGEVCKALWYAYNARDNFGNPLKIIHRDVSPSNILISFDGEVKVGDFGVAKAATTSSGEMGGGLKGKLGYLSPEQVLGREVDHRSDLFSLGIILFECLTLKRLFLGRTDLQTLINVRDADVEKRLARHPEIPVEVANILRKALAREPERRYRNATEFLGDIQDYLFQQGRRVGQESVSGMMHDLFEQEAEQEILPLEIEEVTEARRSVTGVMRAVKDKVAQGAPASAPQERQPAEVRERPLPPDEGTPLSQVTRATRINPAEATFRIRDASGQIFGPVSFSNFLSLLKSRAISEDEMCSMNGGEWVRVGDITALQSAIGQVKAEEAGRHVLFEGALDRKDMVRIICDLSRTKQATGLLQLRQGTRQKQVFFRLGRVRHVRSNLRTELIGEVMRRRGLVSQEQIDKALAATGGEHPGRVGDILLSRGIVRPHELAELLQEQFRERFLEIFQWDSGWYAFIEGVEAPAGDTGGDLDPVPLLADAVRSVYPADLCRAWLADHVKRRLVKMETARVSVADLKLMPRELRIVNNLETSLSIEQLLRVLPQGAEWEAHVYRIVFLLTQCKIYQFR